MVNTLVERATSDLLIGPDWAKNAEICDILNHDISQAKDVVKGIRRRIGSKNPKVQLLALTLLETLMKNCGDIVHMHVAQKHVLHKMVKIVKKKPDRCVKDKILVLIDTWQEAFGGLRARYPQYFAAYQDLLGSGIVFPQKSERSGPVFLTPGSRAQPHSDSRLGETESTEDSEFPTLSLTEIQNARGVMDVLEEMLNALDPGNKEDVIADLVQQCRTYKQRVVHLINSTSDESLLFQGLALNDDLQHLLAKHEAIASSTSTETEKSSVQALIDVDDIISADEDSKKQPDGRSASSTSAINQSPLDLLLPVPSSSNGTLIPSTMDPKMDLLGSVLDSSKVEHSLALVPVGEPQPSSPSQQNHLALSVDVLSQNAVNANSLDPQLAYTGGHAFPVVSHLQQNVLQSPQLAYFSNETTPDMSSPQRQQLLPMYGNQGDGALPPPPWETQPEENAQLGGPHDQQQMQVNQMLVPYQQSVSNGTYPQQVGSDPITGMYVQSNQLAVIHNQPIQSNQQVGIHPHSLQGNQIRGMFLHPMQGGGNHPLIIPGNHIPSYAHLTQFLEQSMSGLSMRDNNVSNSSYQSSSLSFPPSGRPSKPEDKLFGDLLDMAKSKPKKSPDVAGSTSHL